MFQTYVYYLKVFFINTVFISIFSLGTHYQLVQEWNQDVYIDDSNKNHEIERKEETDNDSTIEDPVTRIGTNEVIEIFNKSLEWARHECTDQ